MKDKLSANNIDPNILLTPSFKETVCIRKTYTLDFSEIDKRV